VFGELDKVVNDHDPLIEKFRNTHAAFCNEYQTARSIVDSAASHSATPDNQWSLPTSPEPLANAA
jgi:hypothetical protein